MSIFFSREHLVNLLFGQLLSLLIASSAVSNEFLFRRANLSLPTLQTLGVYLLMALTFIPQSYWPSNPRIYSFKATLDKNKWLFGVGSFADCFGNILSIRTYETLPLAKAALLLSLSTPSVFFFSLLFLRKKYRWNSYLGTALSLVGASLLYLDSFLHPPREASKAPIIGYIYGMLGSLLYGLSNVIAEFLSNDLHQPCDYFSVLSVGGTFWSLLYLLPFRSGELIQFANIHAWENYAVFGAFCILICAFYYGILHFLQRASATMLNVSLLTANIYAISAGYFLFKQVISYNVLGSGLLVTIGILLFSLDLSKKQSNRI